MKTPVQFTKAQIRRAVEGARSAGLNVKGVRVHPDGSIVVEAGETSAAPYRQPDKGLTAWEDLL